MGTPDYKRFFCRYLQNKGFCRFSDTCKFSHLPENTFKIPENVCLFHLKGRCNKKEEQCSFLHISADGLIEQLMAYSRYSGYSSIRANQPSTSREPAHAVRGQPASSAPVKSRKRDYDVKPKPREEILCGICLEDVVGSQKSFGLLVNCNHSFCYDCILQWRRQSNVSESATKSCPECRKPSDLVVPNRRFAIDADKARVIEAYKSKRKNILCKYEQNGRNNCKRRTSCLFKHTLPFRETTALPNSNLILNTIFADASEFELHIYLSD